MMPYALKMYAHRNASAARFARSHPLGARGAAAAATDLLGGCERPPRATWSPLPTPLNGHRTRTDVRLLEI